MPRIKLQVTETLELRTASQRRFVLVGYREEPFIAKCDGCTDGTATWTSYRGEQEIKTDHPCRFCLGTTQRQYIRFAEVIKRSDTYTTILAMKNHQIDGGYRGQGLAMAIFDTSSGLRVDIDPQTCFTPEPSNHEPREVQVNKSEETPDAITTVDPAADFLLDMLPDNLYERVSTHRDETKFRCKSCGAIVANIDKPTHHNNHRAHRAQTKESTMATNDKTASKSTKQSAKDQGVPAEYLGATGNFKPGADSKYKSDLVICALDLDDSKCLVTFKPADAVKRLELRGWIPHLDRKRQLVADKTNQDAKRAQEKADREIGKAQVKRERAAGKKDTPAAAVPDDLVAQVLAEQASYVEETLGLTKVKPDPKPTRAKATRK